jgi:hypothetical protein
MKLLDFNKKTIYCLAMKGMLIVSSGCSSPRTEIEAFEERNSKPVLLNDAGSKVKVSEDSPDKAGMKCKFIREIGNPGIREIESDKNDFRNFAATVGGNYLHYIGLTSKSGITYTSGQIYSCP